MTMLARILAISVALALSSAAPASAGEPIVSYTEACDASAAVALSRDLFVVGNDEDNILRTYRRGAGGRPVATVALDGFLGIGEEADIEAVARVGDRLYWIGSHGRNKKGKPRPARQKLFATDVKAGAAGPVVVPAGRPFGGLLAALIRDPKLASLNLAAAEPLAPDAPGGLNIEAMTALADGTLLIGFRSPIPAGRAIVVPLTNAAELVSGRPASPDFGAPIALDLGGRGLRAMETLASGRVLIVAGPPAEVGDFALYEWSGVPGDAPHALAVPLANLRPEAALEFPDGAVMLVCDDGGTTVRGQACKDVADPSLRSFRTELIQLAPGAH